MGPHAVRHAHGFSGYQVMMTVRRDRCLMQVIDNGLGLDGRHLDGADPNGEHRTVADRGRRLRLMDTAETAGDGEPYRTVHYRFGRFGMRWISSARERARTRLTTARHGGSLPP